VRGRAEPAGHERVQEAGLGEPVQERRRALGLRRLHRARELDGVRRVAAALEQRQRVGEQRAARTRRRVGQHLAAAVSDAHRLARDRLVGRQVGAAERPAVLLHPLDHGRGELAGVERRRALRAEALERLRERRVAVDLPEQVRTSLGHEQRARLLGQLGDRGQDLEQVRLLGVDLDAGARERGRRGAQLGERHRAEALARRVHAGRHAVDAAGGGPDVEHLGRVAEGHVDRHERRPVAAARRGDEEVEQHVVLAGRRHEHVAARAEARQQRLGDEGGEHRGQRRVHGVAAGAEGVRAGLRREGMSGRDDSAHGRGYLRNVG
jgi:hypothetical protein